MQNPAQLTHSTHPLADLPRSAIGRCRHFLLRCSLFLITLVVGIASTTSARGEACEGECDTDETKANTALGHDTLGIGFNQGINNTAVGFAALNINYTGNDNTAIGAFTLLDFEFGSDNTAIGNRAMGAFVNGLDDGSFNVANGSEALFSNGLGSNNVAIGYRAMYANDTGSFNTANGANALYSNTTGISNTADGYSALYFNTTGFNNTANGVNALFYNTTGNENAANGNSALSLNTTGVNNTADGSQALLRNTTGSSNIALGFQAGQNLTTGNDNIDFGNAGVAGESNTIRIGTQGTQTATYMAGIYQVPLGRGALPVVIDSSGHLGTKSSSARFKQNIKPMDKASEAILALKPVTFNYKKELDPEGTPQFGLVAEEVVKVNPDLVVRDEEGKPYTVRYDAVDAMLLNEFLKEHRKVEELQTKVTRQEKDFQTALAEQRKEIEALTASLKKQAAQIEKVSDQVVLSKFATGRIHRGGRTPELVAANQ
jgi:hypothetical protein